MIWFDDYINIFKQTYRYNNVSTHVLLKQPLQQPQYPVGLISWYSAQCNSIVEHISQDRVQASDPQTSSWELIPGIFVSKKEAMKIQDKSMITVLSIREYNENQFFVLFKTNKWYVGMIIYCVVQFHINIIQQERVIGF